MWREFTKEVSHLFKLDVKITCVSFSCAVHEESSKCKRLDLCHQATASSNKPQNRVICTPMKTAYLEFENAKKICIYHFYKARILLSNKN